MNQACRSLFGMSIKVTSLGEKTTYWLYYGSENTKHWQLQDASAIHHVQEPFLAHSDPYLDIYNPDT